MNFKLLENWRKIRSSFWFLPSLMVVGAVALAFTCLWFDRAFATVGVSSQAWWLHAAGADSARGLLSTIAGSMMTVAGVTFSVVIVALTLASSQFGPRLLVRFMEDTGNQVVLGTFISVYLYCIAVLLHLPGSEETYAVPQASVLVGVALAVFAVGVLIYFFHHISTSIQAGVLVREAGRALDSTIESNLPAKDDSITTERPSDGFSTTEGQLLSPCSGYVRTIDFAQMAISAQCHDVQIKLFFRAGDFVLKGQKLASVRPPEKLTDAIGAEICTTFAIADNKEGGTDLCLAIERLTEIAVRGLSPGINDPDTAIAALNQLTVAFDSILERLPTAANHFDEEGELRVFSRVLTAEELFSVALGPIRTYGGADVRVLEAMVSGLERLARRGRRHWNALLRQQVELVLEASQTGLTLASEKTRIESACTQAIAAIEVET